MSVEENLDSYVTLTSIEKMRVRLSNAAEVIAFIEAKVVSPGFEADHLVRDVLTSAHEIEGRSSVPSSLPEEDLARKENPDKKSVGRRTQVVVRDVNVDQALRALKKKLQREGVFREYTTGRAAEKPSAKSVRKKAEEIRRRKLARSKAARKGQTK